MDARAGGVSAAAAFFSHLILNGRALALAIRAYRSFGSRSAREEVREMYDETAAVLRAGLLALLAAQSEEAKNLGEVRRCFDGFSVAGRDLLFAILRFLRR